MFVSRRHSARILTFVAAGLALGLSACQQGGKGAATGGGGGLSKFEAATDIPMGSKDAKVVLVEYASITCPHCASFHNDVLPAIKAKYIDPGKVRYVFREFPTPPVELAMAGHLIARCAGNDKRDTIIGTLMRQQQDMVTQAQGPTGSRQFFLTIAASAGMSESAFEACLKNEALLKTLADVREAGIEAGVQGTPTLFINGEKFEGPAGREMGPEDLNKALDVALAKAG
jgi:protein-disulfide isomerase